jgi:NAD dependent epimerase/dehydratase family
MRTLPLGALPPNPRDLPHSRQNDGAETDGPPPLIPAPESALGLRPRRALSSAPVLPEWITSTSPCNDLSANGDNPLNFVVSLQGFSSNLVRTLLAAGHEVWALARSEGRARLALGDTKARIVRGDIRNVAEFAYELEGVDVLFHTAAYFREYYSPGDHANAVELANVRGTMELAQAAHAMGVRKMIYASAAGIVGLNSDGSPGDEETPPRPAVMKNLYLNSKERAERQLFAFSREKEFFVAAGLPSWMWGPYDLGPTPSRTGCLLLRRPAARRSWMHATWLRECFVSPRTGGPESGISSAPVSSSWMRSSRVLQH